MENINQKSVGFFGFVFLGGFFGFFCNILITLNHVKLEKQFSSDCSQAIFKICVALQSNVSENIKKNCFRCYFGEGKLLRE